MSCHFQCIGLEHYLSDLSLFPFLKWHCKWNCFLINFQVWWKYIFFFAYWTCIPQFNWTYLLHLMAFFFFLVDSIDFSIYSLQTRSFYFFFLYGHHLLLSFVFVALGSPSSSVFYIIGKSRQSCLISDHRGKASF